MRDCANCFHRKPVLKEDGTWTAECEKWDCEFLSRENMIEKTEAKGGDLISRNALKKDFKERLAKCDEWIEKAKDKETKIRASTVKAFIAEVIMTIDNAPTVEAERPSGTDCIDEDAKQASIPYTYNAPQHDWKCGYPDITRGKGGAEE